MSLMMLPCHPKFEYGQRELIIIDAFAPQPIGKNLRIIINRHVSGLSAGSSGGAQVKRGSSHVRHLLEFQPEIIRK